MNFYWRRYDTHRHNVTVTEADASTGLYLRSVTSDCQDELKSVHQIKKRFLSKWSKGGNSQKFGCFSYLRNGLNYWICYS